MKRQLLLIIVALLPLVASAFSAKIDGIYYNLSENEAMVTYQGYQNYSYISDYSGTVVIPESVTYSGKTYSVTSIGEFAFYNCSGLTSITIGSGVTSIGSSAFRDCTGLTSLTIPDGVTSIGSSAFSGCTGLTSLTIPNSVTSIEEGAFYYCRGLTSIKVETGNTIYDSRNDCNAIIETETNTLITGCQNTIIPNSVTSIGRSAFSGCTGLTSVNIPNSVTSIDNWAFYGCTGLTSVNIPNSVTSIDNWAFYGCTGLTSVTIPDGVTSIGYYAFSGTNWLKNQTDGLVYAGKIAYQYKGTMPDGTHIALKDGTLGIAGDAFHGCKGLTSVTIPNSVTSIGSRAFAFCSGLTSVTIPDNVTSIDDGTFAHCSSLTSVTIPNSVTSIGRDAFYGCTGLTSVTILEGVNSIGGYAFSGCTGLTSLTIPNSVTSIGESAFSNCRDLTSITIGNSVTSIGNDAFNGCDNADFYVNRETDGLLALWNYGLDPYETGTSQKLLRPTISVTSKTQTTIEYGIVNKYPDLEYVVDHESVGKNEYLIKGLRPAYQQTITLTVRSAHNSYSTSTKVKTLSISPKVTSNGVTASSISVKGSYADGDANVISRSLLIDGKTMEGEDGTICGLDPNTTYSCKYKVTVEYGNRSIYAYEGSKDITTAALTLTTQQPKVITAGNVVVSAESNLDDEEMNVGFEWRRTDWTDDFASNTGKAYLYEGTMEGYIRNMYTEKLWKYRPYYESNSGERYYGDWVGIDPTNTSYFEPTVHTYATISVESNTAEVRGYAMRGTDNITSQGFMYWENAPTSTRRGAKAIPSSAMIVEAKGNVMAASLENLDYDTEYCYVAFVTTSEGETFYGKEQTFRTGLSQEMIDGIAETDNAQSSMVNVQSIYDLSGRKLPAQQKGLNIIRMSDGTTRKVLLK